MNYKPDIRMPAGESMQPLHYGIRPVVASHCIDGNYNGLRVFGGLLGSRFVHARPKRRQATTS